MPFKLKELLDAIGQAAAVVFAAWIFMGFLQQRYAAAYERYRSLVAEVRQHGTSRAREGNLRDQVKLYRRRCELMRLATNTGLAAAICLIVALILGALEVVLGQSAALRYAGAAALLIGLALVILAASLVIVENSLIRRMLVAEMLDVPELAQDAGRSAGEAERHRR